MRVAPLGSRLVCRGGWWLWNLMRLNLEIPSLLSRNPLGVPASSVSSSPFSYSDSDLTIYSFVSRPRSSSSHYLNLSSSVTDLRLDSGHSTSQSSVVLPGLWYQQVLLLHLQELPWRSLGHSKFMLCVKFMLVTTTRLSSPQALPLWCITWSRWVYFRVELSKFTLPQMASTLRCYQY